MGQILGHDKAENFIDYKQSHHQWLLQEIDYLDYNQDLKEGIDIKSHNDPQ